MRYITQTYLRGLRTAAFSVENSTGIFFVTEDTLEARTLVTDALEFSDQSLTIKNAAIRLARNPATLKVASVYVLMG
jgi:hypothetical protein